jgi:hypothetical protein
MMQRLLIIRGGALAQLQWTLPNPEIFQPLKRVLVAISLLELLLVDNHRMGNVTDTLKSLIRRWADRWHCEFVVWDMHILRILVWQTMHLLKRFPLDNIVEKWWCLTSTCALIFGILKIQRTSWYGPAWNFKLPCLLLIGNTRSWKITLGTLA